MSLYRINPRLAYDSISSLGKTLCLYPELMAQVFKDSGFRLWLRSEGKAQGEAAIKAFVGEKDPQVGLFKASYALAPVHGLVFWKRAYASLEAVGQTILDAAPAIDESAYRLFVSGVLPWYVQTQVPARANTAKAKAMAELVNSRAIDPAVRYFRLGHLLANDCRFHFQGRVYPDIVAFFQSAGGDPKILSSYDFLTMPSVAAYHLANGKEKELAFARALGQTNLSALENFRKAFRLKGVI